MQLPGQCPQEDTQNMLLGRVLTHMRVFSAPDESPAVVMTDYDPKGRKITHQRGCLALLWCGDGCLLLRSGGRLNWLRSLRAKKAERGSCPL